MGSADGCITCVHSIQAWEKVTTQRMSEIVLIGGRSCGGTPKTPPTSTDIIHKSSSCERAAHDPPIIRADVDASEIASRVSTLKHGGGSAGGHPVEEVQLVVNTRGKHVGATVGHSQRGEAGIGGPKFALLSLQHMHGIKETWVLQISDVPEKKMAVWSGPFLSP